MGAVRVAKLTVILGCIMILAGLMNTGDDGPWLNFQSTLSNIPVPAQRTFLAEVFRPFNTSTSGVGTFVGCTAADAYLCFNTADEYDSYFQARSGMTDIAFWDWPVATATYLDFFSVTIICESPLGETDMIVTFQDTSMDPDSDADIGVHIFCRKSTGFHTESRTIRINYDIASFSGVTNASIQFNGDNEGKVTYIEMALYVTAVPGCPDFWDVGCQLGRLFTPIIDFLTGIGQWLWYGGTVVSAFASLTGSTVYFIFNLGAPALVQAIIDLVMIGLLSIWVWEVISLLRGGEG